MTIFKQIKKWVVSKWQALAIVGVLVVALIIWLTVGYFQRTDKTVEDATSLYKSGQTAESVKLFNQIKEQNGLHSAEDWNIYGNVLRDNKQLEQAVSAYRESVKLDGSYETAYRNLTYVSIDWADSLNDKSKVNEVLAILQAGRKKNPKSFMIVEDLIKMNEYLGNTSEVEALKKVRTDLLK
jgi:cytochrome c-type biogenesis protein CcmH/NrfG